MSKKESKPLSTLSKIKQESSAILSNLTTFVQSSVELFRKDESKMTIDEKVEKQHILTFVYGMATGLILYHFLIGAVLIAGVIALYIYSVKKTKTIMKNEIEVKK